MIHDNDALHSPGSAPHDKPGEAGLDRRQLLRRSALFAGVAAVGGTAGALAAPGTANAADGDNVVAGATTTSTSQTTLQITGGGTPTLSLKNDNGPSLFLQPLASDFPGQLDLGEVANTELGPLIGVDSELGQTTTYVATGIDLADLPTPYALPSPVRLLDTRTTAGRAKILRMSTSALDSSGRLRAGAWIDVSVEVATGEFQIDAAYTNLTVVGPAAGGYLSLYAPGNRPATSTLNFVARQVLANGTFVSTGIVLGHYAVRLYTSQLTHALIDLTGVTIRGSASTPTATAAKPGARAATTKAGVTSRLRSTVSERLWARLSR